MSFLAILLALLIEQALPLSQGNIVHGSVRAWVRQTARNFDAGQHAHGWMAWSFAVLLPTGLVLAVHWGLQATLGWPAVIVWHVVILYVTLGFRQFSFHFTGIRDALEEGDEEQARLLLARWKRIDVADLPRGGIVRQVICHSVLAAHHHVFGVLAWYTVLTALGLGPIGAVFYRLSGYVAQYWTRPRSAPQQPVSDALQAVSLWAWGVIDWLPSRITAFAFAVVGSFEDTIDAWRKLDQTRRIDNEGVVVAATAGAIGLNLEVKAADEGAAVSEVHARPRDGQTPEFAHLRSVVGLVWRTVVLWMLLLAMLTLARLLG